MPRTGRRVPIPPHGTYTRQKNHGCTCEECRQAYRDYTNGRNRLIAYGRWRPFADAEPVRRHVRELMAAGVPWRQVAADAGASAGTVYRLLFLDPPTVRIRTSTAERLLAVSASPETLGDAVPVDATGTRRRLQALGAVGWSCQKIAPYLGIDASGVVRARTAVRVHARRAREVAAVYDRLWDQVPPMETVAERAAATRARRFAAERGWPPPLAWDDGSIDDPAAEPVGAGYEPQRYGRLPEPSEIQHLVQGGDSLEVLADRYGVRVDAVRNRLNTIKETS